MQSLDEQRRRAAARLERAGRDRPELQSMCALGEQLLTLLFSQPSAPAVIPEGDGWPQRPPGRQVPLLRSSPKRIDANVLRGRWEAVCGVLQQGEPDGQVERLAELVRQRVLEPAELLRILLDDGPAGLEAHWEAAAVDRQLAYTVLRLCALPGLSTLAEATRPLWQGPSDAGGCCPVCGQVPLLAEIRGLEQLRWLRCGLCAADWQADCLFCPFCERRDHRQLQDWYVEGEQERYRLSVCDGCGGRLPSVNTLGRLSTPELLAAEIELLHLQFVE